MVQRVWYGEAPTDTAACSSANGSTTSLTSPLLRALAGRTLDPVVAIVSAVWMPTTLGSRWVPPAPGSRPSFTSGTARTVFGDDVAMR